MAQRALKEGRDRDRKLAVMRLSATQKAEKAARERKRELVKFHADHADKKRRRG